MRSGSSRTWFTYLPFASRARPAIRSNVEADGPRTVNAIRPFRKSVKRWGIWEPYHSWPVEAPGYERSTQTQKGMGHPAEGQNRMAKTLHALADSPHHSPKDEGPANTAGPL